MDDTDGSDGGRKSLHNFVPVSLISCWADTPALSAIFNYPAGNTWNEYRVCRSLLSVILWISKQLGTPAFFLLWSHCSYVNWTWNQCIYRKHPQISRTLNLAAQILGKKEKKRSLFFLHQKKSSLIHPLFIERKLAHRKQPLSSVPADKPHPCFLAMSFGKKGAAYLRVFTVFEVRVVDEREKWSSHISGQFKQLPLMETWNMQVASLNLATVIARFTGCLTLVIRPISTRFDQ